ncbi:NAD(P)H-dependent flavin oxidoreductase [Bacteroidota bacterium]
MISIQTKITKLFNIQYPIIQAGMIWVSGWKLASSVSNNGGLGLIGSGSMKPELLEEHIAKCFSSTNKPFGVNIPLLRGDVKDLVDVTVSKGVKIVFTSAGNPKKFIDLLKAKDVTVTHVVPSVKFGHKADAAGCDAVVGEGVEAGGHNGQDEVTTMALIPQLVDAVNIPVIAAGGISDGRGIVAALSLGAEGVQMGTRFAASEESSAHPKYKKRVVEALDNDTILAFKKIGLVRMLKNKFAFEALKAEEEGWDSEQLKTLLGRKREMRGIFIGDEEEGEMEAGQSSGLIKEILPVEKLMKKLVAEIKEVVQKQNNLFKV